MCGSSMTISGFWSSFRNPALLPLYQKQSLGISLESLYGIPELSVSTAALIIPSGNSALGIRYSQYGIAGFRRSVISAAGGIRVWETLNAGISVFLLADRSGESGRSYLVPAFEPALMISLAGGITAGLTIFNPFPQLSGYNSYPSVVRLAAGYQPVEHLILAIKIEESSHANLSMALGFEYYISNRVPLRAGYMTHPGGFSLGSGFISEGFTADIAFVTHPVMGITPSISIVWNLRHKR